MGPGRGRLRKRVLVNLFDYRQFQQALSPRPPLQRRARHKRGAPPFHELRLAACVHAFVRALADRSPGWGRPRWRFPVRVVHGTIDTSPVIRSLRCPSTTSSAHTCNFAMNLNGLSHRRHGSLVDKVTSGSCLAHWGKSRRNFNKQTSATTSLWSWFQGIPGPNKFPSPVETTFWWASTENSVDTDRVCAQGACVTAESQRRQTHALSFGGGHVGHARLGPSSTSDHSSQQGVCVGSDINITVS